ncbi:MAG: hypothetical protein J6T56_02075, partial [Bacteroidales bacterium]|nr:hypothetical protein [Bacteroidales bacterium]
RWLSVVWAFAATKTIRQTIHNMFFENKRMSIGVFAKVLKIPIRFPRRRWKMWGVGRNNGCELSFYQYCIE